MKSAEAALRTWQAFGQPRFRRLPLTALGEHNDGAHAVDSAGVAEEPGVGGSAPQDAGVDVGHVHALADHAVSRSAPPGHVTAARFGPGNRGGDQQGPWEYWEVE